MMTSVLHRPKFSRDLVKDLLKRFPGVFLRCLGSFVLAHFLD